MNYSKQTRYIFDEGYLLFQRIDFFFFGVSLFRICKIDSWLMVETNNLGFRALNISFADHIKPKRDRLQNVNFHPLAVVSRYRDPQLQVVEN